MAGVMMNQKGSGRNGSGLTEVLYWYLLWIRKTTTNLDKTTVEPANSKPDTSIYRVIQEESALLWEMIV
jgi:hypothetical protein